MHSSDQRLISQEAAAAAVEKSVATIARLRRSGRIRTWRQGARVLVNLDEVQAAMAPEPVLDAGGGT